MESATVLVPRVDRIFIADKIGNVVLMDVKMTVYHQVWKNTVNVRIGARVAYLILEGERGTLIRGGSLSEWGRSNHFLIISFHTAAVI